MTAEKLKELVHAAPFQPFKIHMANGRAVRVRHPDFISLSPTGRLANVFTGDQDESEFIDVLLVLSVEMEGPQSANLQSTTG